MILVSLNVTFQGIPALSKHFLRALYHTDPSDKLKFQQVHDVKSINYHIKNVQIPLIDATV